MPVATLHEKKAFGNAWWCFAPFILWNSAYIAISLYFDHSYLSGKSIAALYGVTSFVLPIWTLANEIPSAPANYPLWFMRDLVLLFLLSPLLYKAAKYLFPACLIMSLTPMLDEFFRHMHTVFFSPYSISMFLFGCVLAHLSKESKATAIKYTNSYLICIYIFIMLVTQYLSVTYLHTKQDLFTKPLIVSIMGSCILYQIARYIELKSTTISKLALKYAPVTFLTFASHIIIYSRCIPDLLKHSTLFYLCLPLIVFVLMSCLFFALKKWGRPLLHLVAHYKLRPDDIQAARAAKEEKNELSHSSRSS